MRITSFAATLAAIALFPGLASAATVTNLNDSGAGSLRAAITNAASGETIDFNPSLQGTITLSSGQLGIEKNLVINGPGAALITVSGNDVSRVFDVEASFTVVIKGLTVSHGLANAFSGGGIRNFGTLTLQNLVVSQNQSVGSNGGGISNDGTLSLSDSIVRDNDAAAGAGISNVGEMTVDRVTLSGNSSSGGGGGINSTGDMTLSNSTVSDNTVVNNNGAGGGVFVTNDGASAELLNVTISGNQVVGTDGIGGGFASANFNDGVSLTNVTIANNSAANGGGIGAFNGSATLATLVNSLVAGNSIGGDCSFAFVANGVADGGNNIVADNSCGFSGGADPILGPLANNGGPTETQALLSGSPAINQGNPAACLATDQRDIARQGTCDIGAYEFIATPGNIQFNATSYEVNENSGSFQVTITRSGGGDGEVSVQFSTADGTATAGLDYEAVDATVTFADGDMANKIVEIPILSDTAIESDESVQLSLADPEGGAALGANAQAVLTIHDTPSGPLSDENCGNRIDDDGDGQVDCNDSDCDAAAICQGIGGDDDGDVEGDGGCSLNPSSNAAPASTVGLCALLILTGMAWKRLRDTRTERARNPR